MSNLGLARGIVALQPHNFELQEMFLTEACLIHAVIKGENAEIAHVGSTAITKILAKPIIDIAVRVHDLNIAQDWAAPLAEAGYWYKGPQLDTPDRRFFAKGPGACRTVYLHVANQAEFTRRVKFRDVLNADKNLAAEYSRLKQRLAVQHVDDIAS